MSYIDSVVQELTMEQTLTRASALGPDAIFMETTTPSIIADYESLKSLKQATVAIVIVGGPHATYFHREVIEEWATHLRRDIFKDFYVDN